MDTMLGLLCALASLHCCVAQAQTTQALADFAWYCMVPDSDPDTGMVFVTLGPCLWTASCYISPPRASDCTIRSGDGFCLEATETGVVFNACTESRSRQQWEFLPRGGAATKFTVADGHDAGQLMLADASMDVDSCLEAHSFGTRLSIKPCNSSESFQDWMYMPAHPTDAQLLVLPSRLRAGTPACMGWNTYGLRMRECDEAQALFWWVQDTDGRILLAADSAWRLTYSGDGDGNLLVYSGGYYDQDVVWNFDEITGTLTLAMQPEAGCTTYSHSYYGDFHMEACNGGEDQVFAFVNSTAAVTYGLEMV